MIRPVSSSTLPSVPRSAVPGIYVIFKTMSDAVLLSTAKNDNLRSNRWLIELHFGRKTCKPRELVRRLCEEHMKEERAACDRLRDQPQKVFHRRQVTRPARFIERSHLRFALSHRCNSPSANARFYTLPLPSVCYSVAEDRPNRYNEIAGETTSSVARSGYGFVRPFRSGFSTAFASN